MDGGKTSGLLRAGRGVYRDYCHWPLAGVRPALEAGPAPAVVEDTALPTLDTDHGPGAETPGLLHRVVTSM